MSEKWQINRVSTSERIFDKINTEVDRPFGIIVYGADCDYKFKTVDKFLNNLTDVVFTNYRSMMEDFSQVEKLLGDFRSMVVVMNSEDSKVHHLRHECVQKLTEAGAKAVVGVLVKPKGSLQKEKDEATRQHLEQYPPSADGLRYQIIVDEEEEEA